MKSLAAGKTRAGGRTRPARRSGVVKQALEEADTQGQQPIREVEQRVRASLEAGPEDAGRGLSRRELAEPAGQAKLQDILDKSSDAYFRSDASGHLNFVSLAALKLYGYASVEEMLGLPAENLYADGDARAGVLAELRRAGQLVDRVEEGRRKDGTTFWISLNATLLRDASGEIIGTEGVVRDITERKLVEQALRESEEKYRRIVETAFEGVLGFDANWKVNYANRRACQILGYDMDELRGLVLDDLLPGMGAEMIAAAKELRQQGIAGSFELPFQAKNGATVWVLTSGSPIMINGQFAGNVTLFTDINDRKKTEQTLQEDEQRLRAVFDGVQDAIFVEDANGRILDVNQSACQMFGYSREDFLSKTVDDLVPAHKYKVKVNMQDPSTFPSQPVETLNVRADGTQFPIEISIKSASMNGTRLLFVVGRDITERRKVDQALLKQMDELKRWYALTIDREARTLELKREVNALLRQLNQAPRYGSAEE